MVVLTRLGPPEHGIRHTQELTSVFVNEKPLGKGTLYISEARVSWVGEVGQGFSLEYPHVAMHAVQKDLAVFPHENLYLIIDVRLVDSDGTPTPSSTPTGSDDDDDDVGAEEDQGMTEIRFVPEDKTKLEAMFNAMSACQALHPDPADISEEEEGEEEEEEGGGDAPEVEGMFDDAEEDGEEEAASGAHRNGGEPMDEDESAQH